MNFIKPTKKIVFTILLGWIIGFISINIAYMLNTDKITKHVTQSFHLIEKENDSPRWGDERIYTQLDNFTVAIMLSTACYKKKESNIKEAMLNNFYLEKDRSWPSMALMQQLNNNFDSLKVVPYDRYWHGYNVFLKPLLYLMNFENVRIFNTFVQLGLLLLLFITVFNKLGYIGCIPLFLATCILNPITNALCIQAAPVYIITLIASTLILHLKKIDLVIFFCIVGACNSFFDFLTFPIVSLGIPLALYLILKNISQPCTFKNNLSILIIASIAWTCGYVGMWLGKWVCATIFTDNNVFLEAYGSIKFRLAGNVPWIENYDVNMIDTVKANFEILNFRAIYYILGLPLLFVFVNYIKNFSILKLNLLKLLPLIGILLIIALFPIAWYCVIKNHSYIHTFFVYRDLSVLIFCVFAVLIMVGSKSISNLVTDKK